MTINTEVFIRRNKLRRHFESEFRQINNEIREASKAAGVSSFHLKYSQHLLDRAIQREIDETYVFELFHKIKDHVLEVNEFLSMPPRPDIDEDFIDGVEYRPGRLEITDGNLWLGFTVCKPNEKFKDPSLQCKMAIINSRRLPGKASKAVIKTQ